ncbi:glycine zipper 2TM domain-containing protein [Herminiimonas arsenitoxidans]|uniref:glycine zipper 2TM domain-containing protein n=1 Tax=Herminiimonas arsenitoxidans TaxID=1809410 RepID=UPI00097132DC|nr:glycine zipper 2TM domain-containing protein [Herminiimonas arsenitoxidans]
METNNNSTSRIHPLIAAAAVAVLLVCLVGVAAMTGLLPNSNSTGSQKEAIAALEKDAADKAAAAQAAEDKANQARQEADERQAAAIKAENQAKAQAKAYNAPTKVAQAAPICSNCGCIESIRSVQVAAKPSGVGVVGGAVVGGLLGNQIGNGNGRSLATVAGVVGGGFAGNEIEKRTRTATAYEVRVRMDDGRIRTFPYNNPPNWNTGDPVRVVDGYLRAR